MRTKKWTNKIAIFALAIGLAGGLVDTRGVYAEHGKSTAQKIGDRDFPSIFQAWNKAEAGPGVTGNEIHQISRRIPRSSISRGGMVSGYA